MQSQTNAGVIPLFYVGVAALLFTGFCQLWMKWRVWRAGGRVPLLTMGRWGREFQVFREYRAMAEQRGWTLFPFRAMIASGVLGLLLIVSAILAR